MAEYLESTTPDATLPMELRNNDICDTSHMIDGTPASERAELIKFLVEAGGGAFRD